MSTRGLTVQTQDVTSLFDETAHTFAEMTDALIEKNAYARGVLIVEAVERSVAPSGRVLDYGCGPGRLARLVAEQGYRVHGIDPSAKMITEARKLDLRDLRVDFEHNQAGGERLEPGAYDGIICSSVIEYVSDAEALLRNFHRCLRPGGALIVSYANKPSLWRRYSRLRYGQTAPHYRLQHHVWSFAEFRRLLNRAGFAVTSKPKYFEAAPFDKRAYLGFLSSCCLVGTLGLVVARRRDL